LTWHNAEQPFARVLAAVGRLNYEKKSFGNMWLSMNGVVKENGIYTESYQISRF